MKTKYLFFLLLTLFLGVSCQKEDTTVKEGITGNPGIVTGFDANANLKSTLTGFTTQWVATSDIIGFYSDNATISSATPVNSPLAAQFSGVNTQFGVDPAFTWGFTSLAHNFWAYFPRITTAPDKTAVPITLPTAQTQTGAGSTAHVGALDIMVATPVAKAIGDQTAVNFAFNHVFSILKMTVTVPAGRYLAKITLQGPAGTILGFTSSSINITTFPTLAGNYTLGTITGGSNIITLNFTTRPTGATTDVYMVVNPITASGTFTFTTTSNNTNGGNGIPLSSIITKTDATFTRGNIYSVALGTIQ